MRNVVISSLVLGVSLAAAGAAGAQVTSAPGVPLPGAGDSTKITSENREATAAYNQRMGSADLKSSNSDRVRKKGPVAATAADIQAGAALRAVDGPQIGSVESLNADQVIVNTGESKIAVPLLGFGKDDKGLVLNMTAAKFRDAVARAHAARASADSN